MFSGELYSRSVTFITHKIKPRHHETTEREVTQLQLQLEHLKATFEELISHEADFEKLKPIRMQINSLEKAIPNSLTENEKTRG